jgi:hypothetical protein
LISSHPSAPWSIVIDCTSGRATAGDPEGVKDILGYLRKKRDGKVKEKEDYKPKAGSRDLPYVLCDNGKCPYQTRHEELTHISDHTFLAIRFVGATCVNFEIHGDVRERNVG